MAALLKEYLSTSYLSGANAPFIEELYEAYLEDPASVPPEWKRYFDQLQLMPGAPDVAHEPIRASFIKLAKAPRRVSGPAASAVAVAERKQVAVVALINAYRFSGVRQANVDPLKRFEKPYLQELDPAHYGFSDAEMNTAFNSGDLVGAERPRQPLADLFDPRVQPRRLHRGNACRSAELGRRILEHR